VLAKPIDINWHNGLSIYASKPFLELVGDDYGWIGGFDETGMLRCILPYTIIRKAGFWLARFRVETIPLEGSIDIEEEKSFLNSVMRYLQSIGADMVIPATTNTVFRTFPDGAVAAPYGSYIIVLNQPEETLWNNLHSKHRNVIRNAMKKKVEIQNGIKYLEIAYQLVRDTLRRSKLGFLNYKKFREFVLGLGQNIEIFVAKYQGAIQGCAVVPFSIYGAYYLYGGSIKNPLTGAMNLLQWEVFRFFRELGVKNYDFVGVRIGPEKGSKQEGLQMYKQRFGGDLNRGFMWKCPISLIRFKLYGMAVRYLRGGDIVDHEHHKLKMSNY